MGSPTQFLTICLSDHETGAPVAIGIAVQKPKTEENKREGEQTVVLRLYEQINLENATVTGDANFDNQARALGGKGADYVLQLKDPNRHARQRACQKADTTPFLPTPKSQNASTDASTNAPQRFTPSNRSKPTWLIPSLVVLERKSTAWQGGEPVTSF